MHMFQTKKAQKFELSTDIERYFTKAWTQHTRSKALRVASSVVTLPNIAVNPKISNSGDWNAINMAILSSVNNFKKGHFSLHVTDENSQKYRMEGTHEHAVHILGKAASNPCCNPIN